MYGSEINVDKPIVKLDIQWAEWSASHTDTNEITTLNQQHSQPHIGLVIEAFQDAVSSSTICIKNGLRF